MKEISVNKVSLADKVSELKKLKTDFENHKFWDKEEQKYGSGNVIDIINNIDKEQILLLDTFINLITNSIYFFDNILSSMSEADAVSADKFI